MFRLEEAPGLRGRLASPRGHYVAEGLEFQWFQRDQRGAGASSYEGFSVFSEKNSSALGSREPPPQGDHQRLWVGPCPGGGWAEGRVQTVHDSAHLGSEKNLVHCCLIYF